MIDTQLPFRTDAGLEASEAREAARLLAEGLLVPVVLDVVVAADAQVDLHLRARALNLVVPERLQRRGAAVAQLAAAWLWCGGAPPSLVDVAVARGQGRVTDPCLALHERQMPADDVTVVQPPGGQALTVTTGARTAADLLRTLPPPDVLTAAAQVVTTTGTTVEAVAACLEGMPRARGVARARRLLRDWPS